MYCYKIFRLVIMAVIIIYFAGCIWYLVSQMVNAGSEEDEAASFVQTYFVNNNITENGDRLMATCYFAVTTLTTTGYGDFLPRTQNEMILCSIIMLAGVAFFSFIMSSFINIISNYDKKMGDNSVNRDAILTDWMTLVTRFRGSQEGGAG
jgi:hypothetical protein